MTHTPLAPILAFAALLAAPVSAQQPESRADYAGQSWVGLLVAASCPAAEKGAAANSQADLTTADRVTTPAVDDAGVRGSAGAHLDSDANNKVPFTGDIDASRNERQDPGWRKAKKQAARLDAACRVSASTSRFALVLPDGRTLPFDQLANQKVAERVRNSGGAGSAAKIYRVQVSGKLQDGAVALDRLDL